MSKPRIERKRVALDSLKPYGRNPRTHSPEQVEQIARLMREYGQTQPIVVDEKLLILAGHGRRLAAMKIGLNEVDVVVVRGLTPAQKKAYVIADNKVTENAGWDQDLLRLELGELKRLDYDLTLTGFDSDSLVSFLADKVEPLAPDGFKAFGEDVEVDHVCPKCGYAWSGG